MLHDTPLRQFHEQYARGAGMPAPAHAAAAWRPGAAVGSAVPAGVEYIQYGITSEQTEAACEVVATYGQVEAEYAAIRQGAALLDSPHRGTIVMTGSHNDRRDFLNRMLTQELKDLAPPPSAAAVKEAFWLNRKGRIEADLLLIELGDRIVIDVDIHQAARAVETLNEYVFAEDVAIADVSSEFHHIALHGKEAAVTLAAACGFGRDQFQTARADQIRIGSVNVVFCRRDQTGEVGYELIVPYDRAAEVWSRLLEVQLPHRVRPIGWHAYNIARIEAGTPLFNIDFGTANLPHETGILHQRVSFKKGCYLGQEIVARMENLGEPSKTLVGLRIAGELLPVAGAKAFAYEQQREMAETVGVVTSSTLSPMLGASPIAFAMLRSSHAEPGTTVLVNAEGQPARATVGPLRFWGRPAADHA
jgi:folate-binding protein YgfZ